MKVFGNILKTIVVVPLAVAGAICMIPLAILTLLVMVPMSAVESVWCDE